MTLQGLAQLPAQLGDVLVQQVSTSEPLAAAHSATGESNRRAASSQYASPADQ